MHARGHNSSKSHTSSVAAAASVVFSGSSGEAANTLVREARATLFTCLEDPTTLGDPRFFTMETFGATAYIVDRLSVVWFV